MSEVVIIDMIFRPLATMAAIVIAVVMISMWTR